ncbi:MAG: YibE/F family protein, partial [Peptococcaceae bacterium]
NQKGKCIIKPYICIIQGEKMKKTGHYLIVVVLIFLMIALLIMDGSNKKEENVVEIKAVVLATDDSNMIQAGISKIGDQGLEIKILEGVYQGQEMHATNHLMGKMELDNYYKPGDTIIAALMIKDEKAVAAKAVDLYRQNWELALFILFVLSLIVYAGFTGLKALLSFVASLYIIWKILIPGLLAGQNPLILSALVLILLTAIIVYSVAGFTRKATAAFIGTICGLFVTIGITVFFGDKIGLNGMTAPFAETLLYSGHLDLNLKHIFYAAIIIGASGAAMDIAMDVAASMEEVMRKKPDITLRELIQSGFNVGRAVIGTMTTTLLLAYSGGYLTLLMLFMTKNSSFARIVNLKIVAAEIMRTVVGSTGLVLVAPITAVAAGWIYKTSLSDRKPK